MLVLGFVLMAVFAACGDGGDEGDLGTARAEVDSEDVFSHGAVLLLLRRSETTPRDPEKRNSARSRR